MDPFIIKAIQLLLSLSLLIVLHELGHFIPARIFKVKVEKFFLFFDVNFALFKKKIGDTVYGIGWLPLGGYVKIAGMIDESMDKEQMAQEPKPWEFRSKPAWQRLIIMVGGVTVNLLLGCAIYVMIMFVWGTWQVTPTDMPNGFAVADQFKEYGFEDGDQILALDGEPLDHVLDVNRYMMLRDVSVVTVRHQNGEEEQIAIPEDVGSRMFQSGVYMPFVPIERPIIDSIFPESPAELAGLRAGDSVVSINSIDIGYWHQLTSIVGENKDAPMELVVKRSGTLEGVPVSELNEQERGDLYEIISITPGEDGNLGISTRSTVEAQKQEYSFGESIAAGFNYGYWQLRDYVAQFEYVFTKQGATQVGGFGAIGSLFPDQWNWLQFWNTTAFISIILAFMNILPIPALDGGHVMFLLYEMITGRKPNDKFMEYAQMIGFFILIALVLFANGNDIYRWLFE